MFALSLTWLIDSGVEQGKECKDSRFVEEKFVWGFTKMKGCVEKFGIYNKILYDERRLVQRASM